jgi:hypothetical protein
MGLESFKSDDSSWSNNSSSSGGTRSTSASNHDDSHNAFKIIWNGKNTLPIEDNEIIIETKEKWTKVLKFINKKMDIDDEEFNSKSKQQRYDIVSNALSVLEDEQQNPHGKNKECDVCGKTFVFPADWDFVEFNELTCCPSHTIEDAIEVHTEMKTEI